MNKSETDDSMELFRSRILNWFEKEGRDFSWRRKNVSCYDSIVAEILLRKTHAQTVQKMYDEFIDKYPSWSSLDNANRRELEDDLKPIGLWRRRAKLTKELAKIMVRRGGVFSRETDDLVDLPSVGPYVANSILLFCHNQPAPLLDWNTSRVVKRFFQGQNPEEIWNDKELCELAHEVVNADSPRELNWAMIDFGTLVCRRRNPLHKSCPLESSCTFLAESLR